MKLALSRKNLWERLPRGVKRPVGAVLGLLPPELVLGRRFRQQHDFLRESQWWSAERIRSFQVEQLRKICRLAQERSRFYQELFGSAGLSWESIRSPEDIRRLPTIDKATVNENLDAMLTRPRTSSDVDYTTTGGTSGQPLRFFIDADRSAVEFAYLVTGWERAGFRLGVSLAVLRGRVVDPDAAGVRHESDPLLRQHYFSNFHTTDEDFGLYLDRIASIGPCFLHVYPSSATALARYLRRSGRGAPPNVLGLLAESEMLYAEQRALIERTFGTRCFASYGHTEKLVLATECEHSSVYHVWPTYGHFELLDENGRSVTTPGQRGEIVGTGFINTATPFIRYRTGDFATLVAERCERCGRAHPLIEDIQGHRIQEYLIASDGSEMSWTALNVHDDTFDCVRQFQFVQEQPGKATLRLVPSAGFGEAERARVIRNLSRKFDGRLSFEIEIVATVQSSARGKAIYVDQRTPTARHA